MAGVEQQKTISALNLKVSPMSRGIFLSPEVLREADKKKEEFYGTGRKKVKRALGAIFRGPGAMKKI
jgi:hypothetical protein